MSVVQEIYDKGASVTWSPLDHAPNLIALGTKVFDHQNLNFQLIFHLITIFSITGLRWNRI